MTVYKVVEDSNIKATIYYPVSPGGSVVKNPPATVGGRGSVPGLGRFPGIGNCNPLQYSCLVNPMDRGAWQATDHGVTKESDTTELLNKNILVSRIHNSS